MNGLASATFVSASTNGNQVLKKQRPLSQLALQAALHPRVRHVRAYEEVGIGARQWAVARTERAEIERRRLCVIADRSAIGKAKDRQVLYGIMVSGAAFGTEDPSDESQLSSQSVAINPTPMEPSPAVLTEPVDSVEVNTIQVLSGEHSGQAATLGFVASRQDQLNVTAVPIQSDTVGKDAGKYLSISTPKVGHSPAKSLIFHAQLHANEGAACSAAVADNKGGVREGGGAAAPAQLEEAQQQQAACARGEENFQVCGCKLNTDKLTAWFVWLDSNS